MSQTSFFALLANAWAVPPADAVAEVARRATPAVVYIEVEKRSRLAPALQQLVIDYDLPEPPETEQRRLTTGSGVIISAEGRVLTNDHVVEGAIELYLVLQDQRRLPAHIVGSDPRTDIAVLQIDGGGPFSWLPLGDSSQMTVGSVVVAIGNPFDFQSTVTAGIVSAVGRRGLSTREIQDYIQTDAAVNPGSSGGPLLNLASEVIGLNTAIYAPGTEQNIGISFAIPSNMLERIRSQIETQGRVHHPWYGISLSSVDEVDGDPTRRGAEVIRVVPASPAERAAVRRGDVIMSAGGEPTPTKESARSRLLATEIGQPLTIRVRRDDNEIDLVLVSSVAGTSAPPPHLPADATGWAGMLLTEATDELRAHFGLSPTRGVLIATIQPDSPASRMGLRPGDVLIEIAGRSVLSLDAITEQLQEGGRHVVTVTRAGRELRAILPSP